MRALIGLVVLSGCVEARERAVCEAAEDYILTAGFVEAYDDGNSPPWNFGEIRADGPISFEILGCDGTLTDRKAGTGSTDVLVRWTGFRLPMTSIDATISVKMELVDQGWVAVSTSIADYKMCGDEEC